MTQPAGRRRVPNTRLRGLLSEAQMTHETLARAVNAVGAESGARLSYNRTSVAHWLAGSIPRPAVQLYVREALARRLGRAVGGEEAGFGSERPAARQTSRCAQGGGRGLIDSLVQDCTRLLWDRGEERPFSAGTTHGWSLPPGAARTGDEAREFQELERFFASSIDAFGGHHARSALLAFITHDVTRLYRSQHHQAGRDAVLRGAARLAYLGARMSGDVGRHGTAQLCLQHAVALASAAGDPLTGALALRGISQQAVLLGHVGFAVRAAQAAEAAGLAEAPAHARAFLLAQSAAAHAAARDRQLALSTLEAAERAYEREPAPVKPVNGAAAQATWVPGPFDSYPRAGLDYQRGQVLQALGDRRGALAALRSSLRLRAPGDRRGSVLTQYQLAVALLEVGRLDECCAAAETALITASGLHSCQARRALVHLMGALAPYRRSASVRSLLERAREGGAM